MTYDAAPAPDRSDDRPGHAEVSHTVGLLFELVGRMRHHFETVASELGLSPQQARALRHLEEPRPMGDIAHHLHCDASNVTGIVDRLEERGWVERRPDPDDRRRRSIVLTDEGRELRERFTARLLRDRPAVAGLSSDELADLQRLLERCLANLDG